MTGKGLWEWPSAQMAKPPLKMVGMWKSAPSLMLNSLHKTLTSQVGEWNGILAGDFEDVHRFVYIYTHDIWYTHVVVFLNAYQSGTS